jgi:hypothetical protein
MKDYPIVKVTHKNEIGAMVETLDGTYQQRIPWNEFNEIFESCNDSENKNHYYMILKGELLDHVNRQQKQLEFIIEKIVPIRMAMSNKSPKNMLILSEVMNQYFLQFPNAVLANFVEDYHSVMDWISQGLKGLK